MKIIAFDSLRFIWCIFILLHHIGINIYSFHGLPNPYFRTAGLAVDCFFVLSGFLLAKHYFSNQGCGNAGVPSYFIGRIKRLYPEYIFAMLLCALFTNLFAHHISMKTFMLNASLLAGWGNIPNIINGIWYVTILFWVGTFLYSLLWYYNEKARFIFIPIIAVLCLFYLINHGLSVTGHQQPIEFSLLSKGTIRGMLGLCAGIFTYELCRFIAGLRVRFNMKIVSPILHILEIVAAVLLVKMILVHEENGVFDFNLYYYVGYIISLIYLGKAFFLKFLYWRGWKDVSYLSYTIYLTHLILIEILRKHWVGLSSMNPFCSYTILVALCILFGYVCYHMQAWVFSRLKTLLVQRF